MSTVPGSHLHIPPPGCRGRMFLCAAAHTLDPRLRHAAPSPSTGRHAPAEGGFLQFRHPGNAPPPLPHLIERGYRPTPRGHAEPEEARFANVSVQLKTLPPRPLIPLPTNPKRPPTVPTECHPYPHPELESYPQAVENSVNGFGNSTISTVSTGCG